MVANFNKKQKFEVSANQIAFQIAGTLFLIIIFVLIVANLKMYKRSSELTAEIVKNKKQIEDFKKSNQKIKDEIANANNEDYLEKIAYEQLNQQRPGEKEIIFVEPKKKTEQIQTQQNFLNASSWQAWFANAWNWIKSKF